MDAFTAVDTLLPEYCDTLLTRPIRFLRLCTTRVNYASIRLGSHLASAGAENFYSIRAVFSINKALQLVFAELAPAVDCAEIRLGLRQPAGRRSNMTGDLAQGAEAEDTPAMPREKPRMSSMRRTSSLLPWQTETGKPVATTGEDDETLTENLMPSTKKLPPNDQWLFSGDMMKQVVTAKGIKWNRRFAVLLRDHLTFSKPYDPEIADDIPDLEPSELQAMFDRYDYSRDGLLQRQEARDAMVSLKVFTTEAEFDRIYSFLDADASGELDFKEFSVLASRQAVARVVLDYIPLEEITQVDFEVHAKARASQSSAKMPASTGMDKGMDKIEAVDKIQKSGSRIQRPASTDVASESSPDGEVRQSWDIRKLGSSVKSLLQRDVNGGGKTDNVVIPDYDPSTHELHLIISTAEHGHNMGRVFIHVLPHSAAPEWIGRLSHASKAALQRKQQRELEEVYGHSAWSYRRAQANVVYNSFTFQMLTFALIVLGFVIDMAEAQILPTEGSQEEEIFFILDATITTAFTAELLFNLFAHSHDNFRPFTSQGSNWFDTGIVLLSIVNVVLTSLDIDMGGGNAKLLRLLRIGRVVRLFKSQKNLQKLMNAITSAILPVCNAFAILLLVASVYGKLLTHS